MALEQLILSESPWILLGVLTIIFLVGLIILRSFVARGVKRLTSRFHEGLSALLVKLVRKTNILFLLLLSVRLGSYWSPLPQEIRGALSHAVFIAFIIQIGIWASIFSAQWFRHYAEKKQAKDPSSVSAFGLLSYAVCILIWLLVALIILENLGFNVSTLVTGLGIGGVAVALAVQNVLGDLLASLSILLDKPFVVGDAILIGDITGTVEHIGVKTTRIRALSGEQIIVANSDLLGSRIRNFKRLHERRVLFSVGVVYDTPVEQVEALPILFREVIQAQSSVRFDRAHLKSLGDSAILFEIVYYVLSQDFNLYMHIQEQVNLGILKRFKELNIEFAFPTQTLVVKGAKIAVS